MTDHLPEERCDVAVIGAGPAGLGAATALRKAGIERVVVLDREAAAGGIPRQCGHPPFGLREFKRPMTGPNYARQLVATALQAGIDLRLNHTVTALEPGGSLSIASPKGIKKLSAQRVLFATGARETPRSARLVSGERGLGICNTGTLQSMFYLKGMIPFRRPVIVGSEIVSFSALSTCRKAGIRPVAMLEESERAMLRWPFHEACHFFALPLLLATQVVAILGRQRVEAVQISDGRGRLSEIACDGILFTGQFIPEANLARLSHLTLDDATGSPVTDASGRCSDPAYYAAGNVVQPRSAEATSLHVPFYYKADHLPQPVKVAGQCWQEGRQAAQRMVRDLQG